MRTETFQTPGETRLDIRLGAGEIRVETAEVQETTVVLEPLRDNDASTAAVENARVELRERGDGHEVVIDVRDRGRGLDLPQRGGARRRQPAPKARASRRSPVPPTSAATAASARSRSRPGSGDVEFDEIAREANINAASGDVQIGLGRRRRPREHRLRRRADPFHRRRGEDQLRFGRLIIREVTGRALGQLGLRRRARARGRLVGRHQHGLRRPGDRQRRQRQGELKSASGDLKVGIREGTSLCVDARSRCGEVRSELPVCDVPPDGDGPAVELRANTMSGDITVARA